MLFNDYERDRIRQGLGPEAGNKLIDVLERLAPVTPSAVPPSTRVPSTLDPPPGPTMGQSPLGSTGGSAGPPAASQPAGLGTSDAGGKTEADES